MIINFCLLTLKINIDIDVNRVVFILHLNERSYERGMSDEPFLTSNTEKENHVMNFTCMNCKGEVDHFPAASRMRHLLDRIDAGDDNINETEEALYVGHYCEKCVEILLERGEKS